MLGFVAMHVCIMHVVGCFINDVIITSQDPDESSIYYHAVYYTLNEEKPERIACRALYDYNAMRADEMSFIKDAIISDVEKHEGGWWRGNHGRKKRKWCEL